MILVIDNYDSFTYNLVQYLGQLGAELAVHRNDKVTPDLVAELKPEKIVISPGPCTPRESGVSNEIIARFGKEIPTLGVCLGHQCIGHVFGGIVSRAAQVMHGKTSLIYHDGDMLFRGMSNPFVATRYHSLIVERDSVPADLQIIAWTDDDIIMGLRHREYPIWGVQFHPESILTTEGLTLLRNFVEG